MNFNLLKPEVQSWLRTKLNEDYRKISLSKSGFENISSAELAQQLKGLKIAKSKFPFLFEAESVYYPPSVNLEQASSQATALYKSNLYKGDLLIDLTAGMGVDAAFFSKKFTKVIAVERNPELCEISAYNYKQLKIENLAYCNSNFEDFLKAHQDLKPDLIYLDPSRRNTAGKKFLINELEPNLLEWVAPLLKISKKILVKLSPLSDLKEVLNAIRQISEIHLIAVKNEMKELLILIENQAISNPKIKAVNLDSPQNEFEFEFEQEENAIVQFSEPCQYIYEPNVAVMKSGAFKLLSQVFNLKKLESNSHFYTSDEVIPAFPGRIFEVLEFIKEPKKSISGKNFHVISRNYPLSADEIRKRYKLGQSEEQSLIFSRSISGKIILRCKMIA